MSGSDDGWAVGIQENSGVWSPLIEVKQGSSWTVDSSLTGAPYNSKPLSVCQVPGTNEAWAVGTSNNTTTFAAHYDGTELADGPRRRPLQTPATLSSVACVGPDDVWAVGSADSEPLIEHWGGSGWTVVPSVAVPKRGCAPRASPRCLGTAKVWAVGYAYEHHLNLSADRALDGQRSGTGRARPALTCDSAAQRGRRRQGQVLQAVGHSSAQRRP